MEIKICLETLQRERYTVCSVVITIEGMPSGVEISLDEINEQLAKRQQGYGRGGRMKIEKDTAEILPGVRGGRLEVLSQLKSKTEIGRIGKV